MSFVHSGGQKDGSSVSQNVVESLNVTSQDVVVIGKKPGKRSEMIHSSHYMVLWGNNRYLVLSEH